jgi:hypothetical protein
VSIENNITTFQKNQSTPKITPLGTIVSSAAAPLKFDPITGEILENSSRKDRFALQDCARHILTSEEKDPKLKHKIYSCCRMPTGDLVSVLKSKEHSSAFFGNVMTCKNIWACPVCSSIVSERRSSEVREACEIARDRGLKITMITLTTRHGIEDKLTNLIDGITSAFRSFTSHRTFKKYRDAFGVVGFIKSTEITYSDANGWHPHFHIIMFSKSSLPSAFLWETLQGKQFVGSLPAVWITCCQNSGLPIPDEQHGFKISDEEQSFDDKLAEYVSKFSNDTKLDIDLITGKIGSWDLAAEVSKWHSKKGRNDSLTPFDFLRLFQSQWLSENKDTKIMSKYSILFRDFVLSMYRKAQLYWSRGLRALFEMNKELSDSELLEQNESKAIVYAGIIKREFKHIVLSGRRSELLHQSETCTTEQFARYLYFTCTKELAPKNPAYLHLTFQDYYSDFLTRIQDIKENKQAFQHHDLAFKDFKLDQQKAKFDYAHVISITSKYKNVTKEEHDEYNQSFSNDLLNSIHNYKQALKK